MVAPGPAPNQPPALQLALPTRSQLTYDESMTRVLRSATLSELHEHFYEDGNQIEFVHGHLCSQLYRSAMNGTWERMEGALEGLLPAGNFDHAVIYGAKASLPWAMSAVSKGLGVPVERIAGVDRFDVADFAANAGIQALNAAWAALPQGAFSHLDVAEPKSGSKALRGMLKGGKAGAGMHLLVDSCMDVLTMEYSAKQWAKWLEEGDWLVIAQEDAIAYESWPLFMVHLLLETGDFVLESMETAVPLGCAAYTLATLRRRADDFDDADDDDDDDGVMDDWDWKPVAAGFKEAADAADEDYKQARWGVIYRSCSFGAKSFPRHPLSTKPPRNVPTPTEERLQSLPAGAINSGTGVWKRQHKWYIGQTAAEEAGNGGTDVDAMLIGRGNSHYGKVRKLERHPNSPELGFKIKEMGVLDESFNLNRPFTGWERIEILSKRDHPYGYYYGGVPGVLEAVGLCYKPRKSSLAMFQLRLTHMEQQGIDDAKREGALLNTMDVAGLGPDSRESSEAGRKSVVRRGLESIKNITTLAEVCAGLYQRLLDFIELWDEAEAAVAQEEEEADPADERLLAGLGLLQQYDNERDVEDVKVRLALMAQGHFELESWVWGPRAAELGYAGREYELIFAGVNKDKLATITKEEVARRRAVSRAKA